jgi:transglutaminase-like putative cysteine protease/tetratricopeptide (TPR) repeat protein
MQRQGYLCLRRALRVVAVVVCPLLGAEAKEPWDEGPFKTEPRALLAAASSQPRPKEPVEVLLEDVAYDFDLAGRRSLTWRRIYRVLDAKAAGKPWDVAWMVWRPWFQDRPEIRARVVAADGHAVDLDPKTLADSPVVQEYEIYSDARNLIGPLPALADGSVVELQVKVHDRKAAFQSGYGNVVELQGLVPIRRQHIVIRAPRQIPLRYSVWGLTVAPSVREEGSERVVELEAGPFPGLDVSELWLPRRESPGAGFGVTLAPSWQAVAQEFSRVVDAQLGKDDLRAEARKVVGDAKTSELAAERILFWMRDIRYASVQLGDGAYLPRSPRETLARSYGDCKDLATLMVAMLRAAGYPASVALLRVNWWDVRDDVPTLNVFDHVIVYVAGKTSLWIDPTQPDYRVGELPWTDQGRKVLIANARTEHLELLPEQPTAQNVEQVHVEMKLAPSGNGSVEETHRPRGWFAAFYKAVHRLPAAERRAYWEESFRKQYQAALSDVVETGMNSGEQVQLVLRGQAAKREFTTDKFALVSVNPLRPLMQFPAALKANDLQKRVHPLQFVPMVSEATFHIVPPTGFKARPVSEPLTAQLGPATYKSTAQLRPDGSIDLVFRVDGGKSLYSPEEVAQFRQAVNALHVEKLGQVAFDSEVSSALSSGHAAEAVQRGRELVAAEPAVVGHHSRLARALVQLGLGDEARAEARRATELAPDDFQAWRALGWALEHDAKGGVFQEGFDFDGALTAYRRAQSLSVDFPTLFELAVLLEHNAAGERYAPDGHLDEAIGIYRRLRAEFSRAEVSADLTAQVGSNLFAALLFRQNFDDVLALAPEISASTSRDAIWVAATAARQGAEAALAQGGRLASDPAKRRALVGGAALRCLQLGRYSDVRELFGALAKEGNAKDSSEFTKLNGFLARLKPIAEWGITPTDPRFAAVRFFSAFLGDSPNASAPKSLFAEELGPVPKEVWAAGRKRALPAGLTSVAGLTFSRAVLLDIAMAALEFSTAGDARVGWRVRTTGPGAEFRADFFVVLQNNEVRILGMSVFGAPGFLLGLGFRALHLLDRGDIEAARQWIVWARESAAASAGEWQAFLEQSSPEATSSVEGLRKAAVLLATKHALSTTGGEVQGPALRQLAPRQEFASAGPVVVGEKSLPESGAAVAPRSESPPSLTDSRPPLQFGEGMTRPVRLTAPDFTVPYDAPSQAGIVLVKCVLTTEGTAEECKVLRTLNSRIDQAVLEWLARQRWKPVTLEGRPVRVSYVFSFRVK